MTWRTDAGYKAGFADRLLGIRSDYAWYSFTAEDKEYSDAYKSGWFAADVIKRGS